VVSGYERMERSVEAHVTEAAMATKGVQAGKPDRVAE
jgi:hypothetical protein